MKWSYAIKGPRVNPLCGGLYKEDHGSIVSWSGKDPDAKLNLFTWSQKENAWIVLGDQYNEEFNYWQGHIPNCQFLPNTINKNRRIERVCSKS